MKKIKILVVSAILIFTMAAILYLIFQAEKMEKYTLSRNDGGICFVFYSTLGGKFKDGVMLDEALKYSSSLANSAGFETINLGVKSSLNSEDLKGEILNNMKKRKRYVLVEINLGRLVVNKNTALLIVGNKGNNKFQENLEYANTIKNNLKDKNIKINVIKDIRNNHNQDIGYRSVKIEMSEKNTYEDGKYILSNIIESLVR